MSLALKQSESTLSFGRLVFWLRKLPVLLQSSLEILVCKSSFAWDVSKCFVNFLGHLRKFPDFRISGKLGYKFPSLSEFSHIS